MKPQKRSTLPSSAVNPKWDGLDVTEIVSPYTLSPKAFHTLNVRRIGLAVYFTSVANFGQLVLHYKPEFQYNTLEVYDVCVGTDGLHVGYVFRTPLRIVGDPYYVTMLRRDLHPIRDIIQHPASAEKRHVLGDIVFHTHDSGFVLTRLENNAITTMLEH
jgi:hypothetical protein